jgi:hypothetical protein
VVGDGVVCAISTGAGDGGVAGGTVTGAGVGVVPGSGAGATEAVGAAGIT